MSLEAAVGSVAEDAKEQVQCVADALSNVADDCNLDLSPEEAYHLLLAIQCNAHRIKDSLGRDMALGLFPMTSMLNHSCAPNCYHSFRVRQGEQPVLIMRALRDISAGEELCYNYVPLYQSTAMRQTQLLSAYSFMCSCERCLTAGPSATLAPALDPPSADDEGERQYPSDDVLSLSTTCDNDETSSRVLFRTSAEVATCQSLLATAVSSGNVSALKSIFKKLVGLCSNAEKAGALHMCNEIMLGAYTVISKACNIILQGAIAGGANEELQSFAIGAVGYGSLALGCLLKYTKVRNDDVAEFEEMVGKGLQIMSPFLFATSKQPQDADTIDKLVIADPPHFSKLEFIDAFAVVASLCLKHLDYFWDTDPRITELLHLAGKQPYSMFNSPGSLAGSFIASSKFSRLSENN